MNAQQAQIWERTRQVGKRKFILYYGVLGWGLIAGLLFSLIDLALHSESFSWNSVMINLIIFPLGGIWMGNWLWKRTERGYEQCMKSEWAKKDTQGG